MAVLWWWQPSEAAAQLLAGGLTVSPPVITQTGTVYAPSVSFKLYPPVITQTPSVYTPIIFAIARPSSDVTDGSWTNEAGSAVDLYASLDEAVASDADYCKSAADPSTDIMEVALSALTDPASSDNHVVAYRIGKDVDTGQIDITVRLIETSTTIATWSHTDVAVGWTTISQTLTTGQADAISNYGDLRLRVEANKV